ncbi:MAG TPA: signal peptidase I [Granulicella sp.]|jgi:signal peptidase I|nr:signal peptidase I [Granulicella sp.]
MPIPLTTPTETTNAEAVTTASSPAARQTETPLESLASICTLLILVIFAQAFIFQNFEIPSGSMEKTLLIGDHVLVDRLTFAPPTRWAPFVHYRDVHRGDVIVFLKPNPESPDLILVKRAIGLPGDHIHLRNGILYLNGVAQNEPQTSKPNNNDPNPSSYYNPYRDDFPSVPPSPESGLTATWALDLPTHIQGDDLVVPPGMIFAMGDNRLESLDSRYWGFVPRENILGRPMFVYWSFQTPSDQIEKTSLGDRISFMGHIVLHFFNQTRWSRTLHIIR